MKHILVCICIPLFLLAASFSLLSQETEIALKTKFENEGNEWTRLLYTSGKMDICLIHFPQRLIEVSAGARLQDLVLGAVEQNGLLKRLTNPGGYSLYSPLRSQNASLSLDKDTQSPAALFGVQLPLFRKITAFSYADISHIDFSDTSDTYPCPSATGFFMPGLTGKHIDFTPLLLFSIEPAATDSSWIITPDTWASSNRVLYTAANMEITARPFIFAGMGATSGGLFNPFGYCANSSLILKSKIIQTGCLFSGQSKHFLPLHKKVHTHLFRAEGKLRIGISPFTELGIEYTRLPVTGKNHLTALFYPDETGISIKAGFCNVPLQIKKLWAGYYFEKKRSDTGDINMSSHIKAEIQTGPITLSGVWPISFGAISLIPAISGVTNTDPSPWKFCIRYNQTIAGTTLKAGIDLAPDKKNLIPNSTSNNSKNTVNSFPLIISGSSSIEGQLSNIKVTVRAETQKAVPCGVAFSCVFEWIHKWQGHNPRNSLEISK